MSSGHSISHYERIADLMRSGAMSLGEIAEAYGVSYHTVAAWNKRARKLGLLPSRGHGVAAWLPEPCPACGARRSRSGQAS